MPSCRPKSQRTLRLWLAAERSGGEAAGSMTGPPSRGARLFARVDRPPQRIRSPGETVDGAVWWGVIVRPAARRHSPATFASSSASRRSTRTRSMRLPRSEGRVARVAGPPDRSASPSGCGSGDADRLAAQGDDVAPPQLAPAAGLDLAVDANRTVFDQRAGLPARSGEPRQLSACPRRMVSSRMLTSRTSPW
jgi:hypothetical protein